MKESLYSSLRWRFWAVGHTPPVNQWMQRKVWSTNLGRLSCFVLLLDKRGWWEANSLIDWWTDRHEDGWNSDITLRVTASFSLRICDWSPSAELIKYEETRVWLHRVQLISELQDRSMLLLSGSRWLWIQWKKKKTSICWCDHLCRFKSHVMSVPFRQWQKSCCSENLQTVCKWHARGEIRMSPVGFFRLCFCMHWTPKAVCFSSSPPSSSQAVDGVPVLRHHDDNYYLEKAAPVKVLGGPPNR